MQLNSKELYRSSGKEKENRCLAFTSSTKRENRKYHVVVVQRWQRNVLKKRDARAKWLFYLLLFSSFCLSRRRRRCLSSLTVFCRMQIAMFQFAVRRKTRYNLVLLLTQTLPSSSDSVTSVTDVNDCTLPASSRPYLRFLPSLHALKDWKEKRNVTRFLKGQTSHKISQLIQEITAAFVYSERQKMKHFTSSRRWWQIMGWGVHCYFLGCSGDRRKGCQLSRIIRETADFRPYPPVSMARLENKISPIIAEVCHFL